LELPLVSVPSKVSVMLTGVTVGVVGVVGAVVLESQADRASATGTSNAQSRMNDRFIRSPFAPTDPHAARTTARRLRLPN
jgi:hypothetical protein